MQGTRNNGAEVSGGVDLDALLASRLLERVPVKLGGTNWLVRTNLTGTEVMRALALYRTGDYNGLFTLLFGGTDEVDAFNAALTKRTADEEAAAEARARGEKAQITYEPLPYSTIATKITGLLKGLPRMHSALATGHIFRASKALAEFALDDDTIHRTYNYEPEGKSSAS